MSQAAPPAAAPSADAPRGAFGWTFWVLNSIEMFERLAYYGIRYVVPIYIMQATEPGGLHLSPQHKGWIYAWWAAVQSLLPIVTGGFADRYGYKRVLALSIVLNTIGYVMMALLHSYEGFFAGILVLAFGTAFFKPALQGSLAQNLTKDNASVGWGLFYWVVNVGAFGAPYLATIILGRPHSAEGWRNLFLASAVYTLINGALLFTFRDVPSGADKSAGLGEVLGRTIANLFNARLLAWLAIMSCFWMMMYQLWDLHPNFIEDWVDSSMIAAHVPEAWREYGDTGRLRVPQQILISLNAGLILLLMVPVSAAVRKMRTLSAMLIGMTVATGGIVVAGLTGNALWLIAGIVLFSLGEMLTGPKKNEYLGLIAPPGKKGLYLGYVNIPVGVGVFIGSWIAGNLYGHYGEKATLALKELGRNRSALVQGAAAADYSLSLDTVANLLETPRAAAFERLVATQRSDADELAAQLRQAYYYDAGVNAQLAFLYLAEHPLYRQNVLRGLRKLTTERETLSTQPPDNQTPPPLMRAGEHLDQLESWIGVSRVGVLDLVRQKWNEERDGEPLSQAEVVAALWDRFGDEPAIRNALALEYQAQALDAVGERAAALPLKAPTRDIPAKTGIDRTQAFIVLCAGQGATGEELDDQLAQLGLPAEQRAYAPLVYLLQQESVRFRAVARKDWSADLPLLAELTGEDVAGAAILAEDTQAVQAALAAVDWTAHPQAAAYLLGMSVYEARGRAAAQLAGTPVTVTQLLWERYSPQYWTWLPFATIGALATVALGIFGQRAKRWSDMNA